MTDQPQDPEGIPPDAPAEEIPDPSGRFSISLRSLLLLVVLVALLLAALTPWFQVRLIRTNVSRVRADQQTLRMALESYYIDMMNYPACGAAEGPQRAWPNWPQCGIGGIVHSATMPISTGVFTVHSRLREGSGARRTITFRLPTGMGAYGPTPHTLTTPVAYLMAYPIDPFSDASGATFGYAHDMAGYIVWSPGPDGDAAQCGDIGASVEHVYSSQVAQPSPAVIALTYDPTNGTRSEGDIIAVRQ